MKIWLLSDLHIESTLGWDLPPPAERPDFDAMVVAGDLMPGAGRAVRWLQERVADKRVVFVLGNHEAYGRDMDVEIEKAREAAAGTNIFVLENESLILDGVTFVGCSLWTDFALHGDVESAMAAAAERLHDYRRIRTRFYSLPLRPHHVLARHRRSREFIESELGKHPRGPRIVVTHHPTRPEMLRPGTEGDIVSAAYANDFPLDLLRQADVFASGHTHCSRDVVVGGARLVSNPKGYGPSVPGEPCENPTFDPCFTFEI